MFEKIFAFITLKSISIFAENEKNIRRKLCDLKGNSGRRLRHVFIHRMQILNDSFCNAMNRSQSRQDSKLLSQLCRKAMVLLKIYFYAISSSIPVLLGN